MDDDFENESQSAVASIAQLLPLWMTRSLWHARLSVPDTFLLEESHVVRWYYTSASSGKVLKHSSKRLDWEDLLKFFARAGRANCPGKQKDSSWRPGVIAVARRLKRGRTYPVLLTAADLKSLREKHTAHLLNEIVMIQSYITRQPFAGCGVFETDFHRTGQHSTDIPALATFELARWPEDNMTWFEDIETLASDSSQNHTEEFLYRNGDGSSKRVHGVVHRTLAATTKAIVEHVQEKTGEVILRVLAQYAFRPGSGQPTLLWLDSVTTQRSGAPSVQSLSQHIASDEKGIEDESHGQLREETNDRSWTTFFPPKLSELVSGGSVKVARRSVRQSVSSFNEKSSMLHIPRTFLEASKALHASVSGSQSRANRLEHRAMNADDHYDSGLEGDSMPFEIDALRMRPNGQHRQTFTLPTESWAIRSSGWRGLYFSGVGGDTRGGKRAAMSERWPRKRSTGTTMRIDDRRPDLRSAFSSDGRWPWTGLHSQPSKRGPGDGINRRIANKANGCFGDFCHHHIDGSNSATGEERQTPNESCKSPAATATAGGSLLMASNVVPYVSILKCRAEERAISLSHHERIWPPLQVYQEAKTADINATPCWIAERMGVLGTNLNDRGRSEFYRLSSSDRGKAGAPEATQRAVEELLYEEELTHLHPTTIFRPVPVCDSCAMVYGSMDEHRKKTKQLKAVAGRNERVARMAHRQERKNQAKAKPTTYSNFVGTPLSVLRRYTDLNLYKNDSATTAKE